MVDGLQQPAVGVDEVRRRIVVGIGELAVSNDRNSVMITHALGSCIAVCLWDDTAKVAGMLHLLLPTSDINPGRAESQPAAFANTGIPLLFRTAYQYGLDKARCEVRLVGGADVTGIGDAMTSVGKRNILAARSLLWKNGVMVKAEAVGGQAPRTVAIDVRDGRTQVSMGRDVVREL